jgi:RHS repeat-associated protein
MPLTLRRLVTWLFLLCAGVACWSVGVSQASASPSQGEASPLLGALVVPDVESLDSGQQQLAVVEARRLSPEAVSAREVSRSSYEDESAVQAAGTFGRLFPVLVENTTGATGGVPGAHVTGFVSDRVARVELPGGKHTVVVSSGPLAREVSPGHRVALDLSLKDVGGAFEPGVADVGVRIPKDLADGVQLSGSGVSLTPVDGSGSALGGSAGFLDGGLVFYANTQMDTDTTVRPLTGGFETDSVLRSVASPQTLSFRLGVPAGARIALGAGGGSVQVLRGSEVVATIPTPGAVDAEGTSVPVSMSLSGDVVSLMVAHRAGSYRYPIVVDPTLIDSDWVYKEKPKAGEHLNWAFTSNTEAFCSCGNEAELLDTGEHAYTTSNSAAIDYQTQGASHIYAFEAEWFVTKDGSAQAPVETQMEIASPRSKEEGKVVLSKKGETGSGDAQVCIKKCYESQVVTEADENNAAVFEVHPVENSHDDFQSLLSTESIKVRINQEKGPSAHFDTTDATLEGKPNALYPGTWVRTGPGATGMIGIDAYDPGMGLESFGVSSPHNNWSLRVRRGSEDECASNAQCDECHEHKCPANRIGGPEQEGSPFLMSLWEPLEQLPEGEDTVDGGVTDTVGLEAGAEAKIKVDDAAPKVVVTGLPGSGQLTEQEYHLKVEVTDGTGSPSSGVHAGGTVTLDGRQLGAPLGGCAQGTCTVTGEYTLLPADLGAGEHRLEVAVEDNAGNSVSSNQAFSVDHATPVPIGPGEVDPLSGQFALSASDVAVAGGGGPALTVQRSYRSDGLTAGAQGPLGPQWSLSVGGQESITALPTGAATLTAANGGQTTFTATSEGKFQSPNGDSTLVLTEAKNAKGERTEYVLANPASGLTTHFTSASGPTGTVWKPTKQEGPLAAQTVRYIYQTSEGITEPKYAVGPEPTGLAFSCIAKLEKAEKLENGCRALEFKYSTATTATGESESEWGEYKGRLNAVAFIGYSHATKGMVELVEAQYRYDKQGRLRAEYDPEITPNLKTLYGYDAEGHVTAVTPAGQQPWLLHYGTVANTVNSSTRYLLSVIRPAAGSKREPKIGLPSASVVPTLSSSKPVVGTKISVATNGTWTNSPLAYDYQWQRCNTVGEECAPIAGAANQSYYPVKADEGHTLKAEVVALNGTGAGSAVSVATSAVASGTESTPLPEPPSTGTNAVTTVEYHVALYGFATEKPVMTEVEVEKWGQQKDHPIEATAIFPPDAPMGWPADAYKRATIEYFDLKGRTVNVSTPGGGVSTTEYNSLNDVVRTLSPDNRASALKEGCVSKESCASAALSKRLDSESTYEEAGSEPGGELLSTLGPEHGVELANGTYVAAREHKQLYYNEGAPSKGGPYRLVTKETDGAQYSGGEADVRTTTTSYSGQEDLGWTLRKPTSVTIDPSGLKLTHRYSYEEASGNLKETTTPAGVTESASSALSNTLTFGATGKGNEQFENPVRAAVDASGDILVVDAVLDKIKKFSSSGAYLASYGESGSSETTLNFKSPVGIAINQTTNDVYVGDQGNNRIVEFSESTGKVIRVFGKPGSGAGELKEPDGIALDGKGHLWVADSAANSIEEFSEEGTYIKSVGERGTSCGDFINPLDIAISGEDMYVTDNENARVEKFTEEGKNCTQFGSLGSGHGQFKEPTGVAIGSTGHVYVADKGNDRVQEFTTAGGFLAAYGAKGSGNGQFLSPRGIAVLSSGAFYVTDATNNRVEEWTASAVGAHTSQTAYYSAGEESAITTCRKHPEWAGLACQTQPASQPETGGMPNLPVTTYTYNVRDEPETTTETVEITKTESKTRTKTITYDAAGRQKTEAISSTVGTALPTVTDTYNGETGALEKQSTTSKTITGVYNTLGQLESYTDADENKATYEYDIDGRPKKTNDGKGTQTYTYNTTSGLLEELVDSSHEGMKFTATYDSEGNILTEGYPNGMTATYTYNALGKPTGLEYKKMTHCTEEKEKCVWFKDTVEPSIHGQWLEQTSTLSHQAYTYDTAGRLTQVQNTPAGKGCTTRIYAYDEDTNRLNLTTREPNSKGECAAEGAGSETHEPHMYDTADRLADPGVSYNTFGDITALPAADAGGTTDDELTSTYYVDNQLASQTQEGQTIGYNLDPAGRTREIVDTGKKASDTINHYAGPGDSPAWTKTSSEWTRNIPGITGSLSAIQNNGETPVLQLTNLHGDIIATAYLSETATGLASTADTSEYGVPAVSAPPKYSWLGASEIPTELPSGVMAMGLRSYVPQLGRFLQPDPIAGGSANAYAYTFADPVNTADPSGAYTMTITAFEIEHSSEQSQKVEENYMAEKRAAEEAAARQAAKEAAERAAELAAAAGGPQYATSEEWGPEEEWEEWWEEEGEYEYAANHHNDGEGYEEARIESRLLYEPQTSENAESGEGTTTTFGFPVPLCKVRSTGPCARDAGGFHGNCGGNAKCKAYKRTHPIGSNVPSAGDTFCQAAGVPSLIRAVAGSPVGVFVAVGCAAKGVYELAGGH